MGRFDDHCERAVGSPGGIDRRPAARRRGRGPCVIVALLIAFGPGTADGAKPEGAFDPPVVDADAQLSARRARVWNDARGRYVLLHGDVAFAVGNYGFTADAALVRIETDAQVGRRIRHLALYLQNAAPGRGGGATWAEARRLLVTASTSGGVELTCDLMEPVAGPVDHDLVAEALPRFERYDARLRDTAIDRPVGSPLVDPPALAARDTQRQRIRSHWESRVTRDLPDEAMVLAPRRLPAPGETVGGATTPRDGMVEADAAPTAVRAAARAPIDDLAILPEGGTVVFTFRNVIRPGPEEYGEEMLFLMGKVAVVYQDAAAQRTMSLRAERVVIFLAPDALPDLSGSGGQVATERVRGIYLEDNVVATDGLYTVRGPRIYYDPIDNRAVVLDAVFYAWDPRRKVPIYMRADLLRQRSRDNWTADRATLTTSEFSEPHFAIAASDVTFRQTTGRDGEIRQRFKARNTTVRVGAAPVFYWPALSGEANDLALKRLSGGYDSDDGVNLRSRWDVLALLGHEPPDGVNLTADLDVRGEHGFAAGTSLDYRRRALRGTFDGYLVPLDDGEDDIANRRRITHDDETRGYVTWQHRQELEADWDLSLELAAVSDETFLEEFFRAEAESSKPYETSAYAKKQRAAWAFTALGQYDLNDFTPQTTPLQSPGYTVEKLPELGAYIFGSSVWDDRLTYSSENRLSHMRINLGSDTPASRGFTAMQSLANFGIADPTVSFRSANPTVPTDDRLRLDSRHEVQAPMTFGPLDIVPFAAGRVTAYDGDFDTFSPDSDSVRLWSIGGVRLHAEAGRTYDSVEARWLDLHRLRHVVEPAVDLAHAEATVSSDDYPVYDTNVEDIREGSTVRVALRNTLQTQRGGPGRWRTVDWVVLNTEAVFTGRDADVATPVARYIGYRPEFSTGGDHFYSDVMWMISDTLAAVAEINYNMEDEDLAIWRIGTSLQRTPRLKLYIDVAQIETLRSQLMTYGFDYELSQKYRVGFVQRLDFERGGTRSVTVQVERRLPRWRFAVVVTQDVIQDSQTFAVVLRPEGVRSALRPLGLGDNLLAP